MDVGVKRTPVAGTYAVRALSANQSVCGPRIRSGDSFIVNSPQFCVNYINNIQLYINNIQLYGIFRICILL